MGCLMMHEIWFGKVYVTSHNLNRVSHKTAEKRGGGFSAVLQQVEFLPVEYSSLSLRKTN